MTEDDDGEAAKILTHNLPKSAQHSKRPLDGPQMHNWSSDEQRSGEGAKQLSNRTSEWIDNLPRLDGIVYEIVSTDSGRDCVIATGNTLPKKDALKKAGFQWDGQQRAW